MINKFLCGLILEPVIDIIFKSDRIKHGIICVELESQRHFLLSQKLADQLPISFISFNGAVVFKSMMCM